MHVLVVDIGGTNVKLWRTGEADKVKFPSGKELTPDALVKQIRENLNGFAFDRVSIGYPGHIVHGRPSSEPYNLAEGWVGFDYARIFECPVRIMNDACMQALGSYEGGKMLYLGLGTSIGTAFITDGTVVPLALGHLKLHQGETFEHFLSRKGLDRLGVKSWRQSVIDAAHVAKEAFLADYVVVGGGNAKKLKELPDGIRLGSNQNAYFGGLRMWEDAKELEVPEISVFPKLKESS
jgi:predicted NBD/HSP70 family sugar kinase